MELITYRKFSEADQVLLLVDILNENNIPYQRIESREGLDLLWGDKQFTKQIIIKIRQDDFQKVDKLLLDQSVNFLDEADKDHYLFGFSNDELYEILTRPDEWSEFDFLLAQKILIERGERIDPAIVHKLKEDRLTALAQPEKRNRVWIYIGYLSAFIGGVFGILVGWHLSTYKKILPDGKRVYEYDPGDRAHGWRMMIVGGIMLIFWILFKMINHDAYAFHFF